MIDETNPTLDREAIALAARDFAQGRASTHRPGAMHGHAAVPFRRVPTDKLICTSFCLCIQTAKLIAPDSGSVSLLGGSPQDAVAGGLVGAMLQAGALIRDVSVRELLAMMASLYPAPLDVEEALGLVGLTEIADRRTHKLSGGQAQRVRFALPLVSDPAVLILDEPTVGMDVGTREILTISVRARAAKAVGAAFRHDGRDGDGRFLGDQVFERLVLRVPWTRPKR